MNIQSGELGAEYIKKYCLLHFDLTILLTASNDTEFVKHLYKILTSHGKKVMYLRSKAYQSLLPVGLSSFRDVFDAPTIPFLSFDILSYHFKSFHKIRKIFAKFQLVTR